MRAVYLDGPSGVGRGGVHDESVAAIGARKVHHQPQLVDFADFFEDRHEFVLVKVPRNLAHKNLASLARRRP